MTETATRASIEACIKRQEQHIRELASPNHSLRRMLTSDRHGGIGSWLDSERECLRKLRALL